MPTKNNNIIKYNHGEKSIKLPFVIYADLECLLEKMSTCINNSNESSTTKINKHTPSGYSIFTHCSFDKSKHKLNYYRGKDCMKRFSKGLREHVSKIINYEKKKMIPLPTGKNEKVISLMKDELGGKIITEFVTLRPKTYSFLTDDGKEDKKAKGTKKCIIKKMIKFNDYKKCLLNGEIILKSQQRFISNKHDVYTEDVNKIALSNDDDKRIVSRDKISSYPYGYMF